MLQTCPEPFKIAEHRIDAGAKIIFILFGHPGLIRSLHGRYRLFHCLFVSAFKLPVKREIGEVHLGIMRELQVGQARNQLIPHRDGHVLESKGCSQRFGVIAVGVESFHPLYIDVGRREHRSCHGFVYVDADGSQKVSIEEFMPMTSLSVAQFGVQDLGQFIGYPLVFGIDKLRNQDSWEKPRKVIELECEFMEVEVGEISLLGSDPSTNC